MIESVATAVPALPAAEAAAASAARAAAAAGVRVREESGVDGLAAVCRLFREIWSEDPSDPSLTPLLLLAVQHAGGYAAVAEDAGELVGACAGFLGRSEAGWELHSHIAGVAAAARGRHVGFALKTHQRAWALSGGLDRISWTYDPLVRRNAYFNLTKLAARSRKYLVDFYGPMTDGINAGESSDRLVAQWDLLGDEVVRACAGDPPRPDVDQLRAAGAVVGLGIDGRGGPRSGRTDAETVLVAVPADIEKLRETDRPRATAWRHAVRDVLGGLLAAGAVVTGFDRSGWYVVRRDPS